MALTTEQIQQLILTRIGDVDDNGAPSHGASGVAQQQIARYWEYHAAAPTAQLRELYVERDLLRALIGTLSDLYDTQAAGGPVGGAGQGDRHSQRTENRRKRLADVLEQIKRAERGLTFTLTTAPYTLTDCIADATVEQIA